MNTRRGRARAPKEVWIGWNRTAPGCSVEAHRTRAAAEAWMRDRPWADVMGPYRLDARTMTLITPAPDSPHAEGDGG